jgi:hypothetical protein
VKVVELILELEVQELKIFAEHGRDGDQEYGCQEECWSQDLHRLTARSWPRVPVF